MGKMQDLEKIRQIVEEVRTCMFITQSDTDGLRARPMATASYDEHGNIWFMTDKNSEKIEELNNLQPVVLTYSNTSTNTYLSITGRAEVSDSLEKKKELFSIFAKIWFPDGPESDKLGLIKFVPIQAEYWDSPDSSIVQLYRMGKSLVTGSSYQAKNDEHGEVSLN